jgi:predicted enzyme related to lactoylglutathione lyase
MEKVLGFGGFFFRSRDPQALAAWYADHLGIRPPEGAAPEMPWSQEAGFTVFSPFAADTDYFGNREKQFMLNFRVADLEAMLRQLEAAGIAFTRDPEDYPYGRFARLTDPEGNPIELWEPREPA